MKIGKISNIFQNFGHHVCAGSSGLLDTDLVRDLLPCETPVSLDLLAILDMDLVRDLKRDFGREFASSMRLRNGVWFRFTVLANSSGSSELNHIFV